MIPSKKAFRMTTHLDCLLLLMWEKIVFLIRYEIMSRLKGSHKTTRLMNSQAVKIGTLNLGKMAKTFK